MNRIYLALVLVALISVATLYFGSAWLESRSADYRDAFTGMATLLLFLVALASASYAGIAAASAKQQNQLMQRQYALLTEPNLHIEIDSSDGLAAPGEAMTVRLHNRASTFVRLVRFEGALHQDGHSSVKVGSDPSDPIQISGQWAGVVAGNSTVVCSIRTSDTAEGAAAFEWFQTGEPELTLVWYCQGIDGQTDATSASIRYMSGEKTI